MKNLFNNIFKITLSVILLLLGSALIIFNIINKEKEIIFVPLLKLVGVTWLISSYLFYKQYKFQ